MQDLKNTLLRSLYKGALAGAALSPVMMGCINESVTEQGNNKPWTLNKTTYTSSCLEDGESYTEYPHEGWEYNMSSSDQQTIIVCAPQSQVSCKHAMNMDAADVEAHIAAALGSDDACPPSYPYADGDGNVCGPVVDSDEECCYRITVAFTFCVEGRPFTVDGMARLARVKESDGWCDEAFMPTGLDLLNEKHLREIAFKWAEAGTHEHASVASFAKFIMELMSLGAPLHLVQSATNAMHDEIRHARDCFTIASSYAGKKLGPDKVSVDGGLAHVQDEEAILKAAIYEACIGETLAASVARWMAPKAIDDHVREIFEQISMEEGSHAQLGWEFVQWMLYTRPHLIPVAKACFEESYEEPCSPWAQGLTREERILLGHGCIREPLEDQLRRRAYHTLVIPCADLMFSLLDSGLNDAHAQI